MSDIVVEDNAEREDYIDINILKRIDYSSVWHPDDSLISNLTRVRAQLYVLGDSNYACIVVKLDSGKLEFKWITWHSNPKYEGRIIPSGAPTFEDVMNNCSPENLEELLYHLDMFT